MIDSMMPRKSYSFWREGAVWLLLLGPLFFLSYGQVNQFTATRDDVGSVVFDWESHIPFLPWTIIPYWSIDLLYGMSLFICHSRHELNRHALRLLAASLVACIGFLLFPLRFTLVRPETEGIFGWLFRQLEQFDLPYNQAPSLHIILTWLLWLRFRQHVKHGGRFIAGAWFLLIAISVLTTWQHHVIDVISGLIVAVIISYVIPIQGKWRWTSVSSYALRLAAKYAVSGGIFLVAGLMLPYAYFLLWPAAALLIVAVGYSGAGTTIFQKNEQGALSLSARLLLWPYLTGAGLSRRWFSYCLPKTTVVTNGLYMGGFPDDTAQCRVVLDLTAECHKGIRLVAEWYAYPLMDLVAPDIEQLDEIVKKLMFLHRKHGSVLVCCALGLSRSTTVVAAWLLATRRANSVQQAINYIQFRRPQVVLTPAHICLLEQFQDRQCQKTS